jgi:hypothetical protein
VLSDYPAYGALILILSLVVYVLMMFGIRFSVLKLYGISKSSTFAQNDISILRLKNKLSIVMIVFALIALTGAIIVNYLVDFNNPLISMIYIAVAAVSIIYGFIKRLPTTRVFGLVFVILSLAKLFILDLSGAGEGLRIISYFAFGIIIILISAVYQHYNKKLKTNQKEN